MFKNWLARRCAPSAVPQVEDVVETSEMARQNGKELSYPRNRQGQVCVGVYGRCCGSIVAKKIASLGVAPRDFIWTRREIDSATRNEKCFNRSMCYHVPELFCSKVENDVDPQNWPIYALSVGHRLLIRSR